MFAMASSTVMPAKAAEPNKAFMAASAAKARERARVKNGHLTTLSRLVLFSPKVHKKTDRKCQHWSVVSYGDFKWMPAGINEHTKLSLADRTSLRMLQYISPSCPKWESFIFCRVEYGNNLDGIHPKVIHMPPLATGLSEDDVWADIEPVILDHNALIVAGNSPEKAYKLLANTWREAIFLKYEYRQVKMPKQWNFDGKHSFGVHICQGGDPMALRFSENPKHDPLEITATSGDGDGDGEGVESVQASEDEVEEEGEGRPPPKVYHFSMEFQWNFSNSDSYSGIRHAQDGHTHKDEEEPHQEAGVISAEAGAKGPQPLQVKGDPKEGKKHRRGCQEGIGRLLQGHKRDRRRLRWRSCVRSWCRRIRRRWRRKGQRCKQHQINGI